MAPGGPRSVRPEKGPAEGGAGGPPPTGAKGTGSLDSFRLWNAGAGIGDHQEAPYRPKVGKGKVLFR
jgi:hypothetical protein